MKIEELTKIVNKLKENNKDFTKLDLSANNIGDKEIKLIAEALRVNKTITYLNFLGNQIGKKGAEAIAKVLKENKTLTTLNLADNQIGKKGTEAIAKVLKENKTLTTLNLADNQIGDEGAEAIAKILKENKTLTELYLAVNQIGNKGLKLFVKALESNKTLTTLNLFCNPVGGEEAKALVNALEVNKNYIKEVAGYFTSSKIQNFNYITYHKLFQALDKNLLAKELESKGIKNTKEFLQKVDTYIKAHLFQLSGVAKDPIVKIAYSSKNFKDQNNSSDSVKSGSKMKLTEGSDTGSNKTDVLKSNILGEPLISELISEFLGDKNLFTIKITSDSNVQQLGDDSGMSDDEA